MKTYEVIETLLCTNIKATLDSGKELWIPTDPANSDYAEYLRYQNWVAAGNSPESFWEVNDGNQ